MFTDSPSQIFWESLGLFVHVCHSLLSAMEAGAISWEWLLLLSLSLVLMLVHFNPPPGHTLLREFVIVISILMMLWRNDLHFQMKRTKLPLYFYSSTRCVSLWSCPTVQCSVQFCRSVKSNPLGPHGLKHARRPVHHQLPGFTQTHVNWVSDVIQPSHSLSPLLLPLSIFPSLRIFSNESVLCIRWPKYWSFSFNISLSNEYSGLISFRMDWLDLLAVQGTLKSFLQHHGSKVSTLWHSGFFTVQLSHPYMTTGKTIALTRWTFVGNVILLFNMLSSLVISFLPRSKCLLSSFLFFIY